LCLSQETLLRQQVEKLLIFQKLTNFLKEKEDHQATRNQLLDLLADLIPNENCEQIFMTLVNWGRYVELFGYNDDSQTFYLDTGK